MKHIGSNVYVLDLPPDWGISSTFNISDLKPNRSLLDIPHDPFLPPSPRPPNPSVACSFPTLPSSQAMIATIIDRLSPQKLVRFDDIYCDGLGILH